MIPGEPRKLLSIGTDLGRREKIGVGDQRAKCAVVQIDGDDAVFRLLPGLRVIFANSNQPMAHAIQHTIGKAQGP